MDDADSAASHLGADPVAAGVAFDDELAARHLRAGVHADVADDDDPARLHAETDVLHLGAIAVDANLAVGGIAVDVEEGAERLGAIAVLNGKGRDLGKRLVDEIVRRQAVGFDRDRRRAVVAKAAALRDQSFYGQDVSLRMGRYGMYDDGMSETARIAGA